MIDSQVRIVIDETQVIEIVQNIHVEGVWEGERLSFYRISPTPVEGGDQIHRLIPVNPHTGEDTIHE